MKHLFTITGTISADGSVDVRVFADEDVDRRRALSRLGYFLLNAADQIAIDPNARPLLPLEAIEVTEPITNPIAR